jgi:hypothetical protein
MGFVIKGVVMKRLSAFLMVVLVSMLFVGVSASDSEAGLLLGVHYLETLGDIKDADGFNSSSLGFMGGFSFGTSLLNFEADLEWTPDYAFGKDMLQPQAYAFIGHFLYGGVGVGIGHINGEWQDSPFFALRAGVRLSKLDLFTSYRFQEWEVIESLGTSDANALTFGALFKF